MTTPAGDVLAIGDFYREGMRYRTRVLVLMVSALSALVVATIALLRMLAPELLPPLPVSLLGRLGSGLETTVELAGALAVLVVVVLALAVSRGATPAPSALTFAAIGSAALLAVSTPGGVIPAAGYTFAACVAIGAVVFIVLIVLRRPWIGILLGAAAIAVATYAVVAHEAAEIPGRVLEAFGVLAPQAAVAAAHVLAAAGLLAWAVTDSGRGRIARLVLRHRTAITVIAAACALPYVLVRATWLTPWPQFGGGAEAFNAEPSMHVMGLVLGFAMLMGGVLTLGLIRPWGERFPRFLAGLGGRAVPVALAVIPASIVSVLFTAAGAEFVFEATGDVGGTIAFLVMFPFWLWGPLLGLATWGYALHRRSFAAHAATGPAPALGRVG